MQRGRWDRVFKRVDRVSAIDENGRKLKEPGVPPVTPRRLTGREMISDWLFSTFLLVSGAAIMIWPSIGNYALKKTHWYLGGVIEISEEQKESRPFFIRLMGLGWIIGGVLVILDSA